MFLMFNKRGDEVDIVLVLEKENIDRVMEYDPVTVDWNDFPEKYAGCKPRTLSICYATIEEIEQITQFVADGERQKALSLLSRGWQNRPEFGDGLKPVLIAHAKAKD